MKRLLPFVLLCVLEIALADRSGAVEIVTSSSTYYNTTDNISSTVSNWSSGWGGSGIDGWDYVGSFNGASGVYLGDGWVLTASHVGAGDFNLDGNTYDTTGVVYNDFTTTISGSSALADLTLFQISTVSTTGTDLTLPSLAIDTNPIPVLSGSRSLVVMIGNGANGNQTTESWGVDVVTGTIDVSLDGTPYTTKDFFSATGAWVNSGFNWNNQAQVVLGDSGGADFINVNGTWELAGLNEAIGTISGIVGGQVFDGTASFFENLSTYSGSIQSITATPEPSTWMLFGAGAIASACFYGIRRTRR